MHTHTHTKTDPKMGGQNTATASKLHQNWNSLPAVARSLNAVLCESLQKTWPDLPNQRFMHCRWKLCRVEAVDPQQPDQKMFRMAAQFKSLLAKMGHRPDQSAARPTTCTLAVGQQVWCQTIGVHQVPIGLVYKMGQQ